jgi:hypothetical protein
MCLGSGSGGIEMSKSENSEMDRAQLGNPSNEWISGSYRGSNSIPPLRAETLRGRAAIESRFAFPAFQTTVRD